MVKERDTVDYWRAQTIDYIQWFLCVSKDIWSLRKRAVVASIALSERCDEYGQLKS